MFSKSEIQIMLAQFSLRASNNIINFHFLSGFRRNFIFIQYFEYFFLPGMSSVTSSKPLLSRGLNEVSQISQQKRKSDVHGKDDEDVFRL